MYLKISTLWLALWSCSLVLGKTDFSVITGNLSTWDQHDWSITATNFIPGQFQSRLSLSNGYVGASVAAAGPFFERDVNQTDPDGPRPINGWPLFDERIAFSTISGFFDVQPNGTGSNYPWLNQYGWESFIAGIPHSTAIIFSFGETYLDATVKNTTISDYKQKLSMKSGITTWSYTWTPEDLDNHFNITYTAIFSRKRPNVIAVSASITPAKDVKGTVTDLLDGRSAVRTFAADSGLDNETSIFSAVHPDGLPNITAIVVSTANFSNAYTDISSRAPASGPYVPANDSTIGQSFDISLKAHETAVFYKYIGVASTDKFSAPRGTAWEEATSAYDAGWESLVAEHEEAWGEIMTEDAVENFTDPKTGVLPEDPVVQALQVASVANMFYLLQNMQPDGSDLNDNSIAVGGLASDSYAGLIFWDADYWMAPGLNIRFPEYAKQISNFRMKQHEQSLANAAFNGYPDGSSLYSWTSGRYGNCTGTGPCVDYEYHLNYDIAFNLIQLLNVTNNQTWFENGPAQIIKSTAMMTSELLSYNSTTKTYWIRNMTDPDEYANNVDNGAFTIASASNLLTIANALQVQQGLLSNNTWEDQGANIEFPRVASNITKEFQTMNNSVVVKQADVVLLTYPLNFNTYEYDDSKKLLDLDYYSNKQSPDGPAMTYSVFAVDANALSQSGCAAYTYTLNAFLPYLRAPWYQFSEQQDDDVTTNGGTNPAFPFLTGHGGANQVAPFAFLGLRTDLPILTISPSLPPQIPYLRLRTIYYAGAGLSVSMNTTHTTITRLDTSSHPSLTDQYSDTSMPIAVTNSSSSSNNLTYLIDINETLTIKNRDYSHVLATPDNLLQCSPVTSSDLYAAGQFPEAAVDGATATSWQPVDHSSATLVVNMSSVPAQRIKGVQFYWGSRPPLSVKVVLSNETDVSVSSKSGMQVIDVGDVKPSLPYDETASAQGSMDIEPVRGNETVFLVGSGESVWSGKYAYLEVTGCWEQDGDGATVGEFVLLGMGE